MRCGNQRPGTPPARGLSGSLRLSLDRARSSVDWFDHLPAARRFLRRRLAFAVARRCQGASTASVPRPDITASVEDCNAAAFSMNMRLYSAGVQVLWAIIKVRRAIVSHDASIIWVMIKGSERVRRWMDLRMVLKSSIGHDGTGGGRQGGVKVLAPLRCWIGSR